MTVRRDENGAIVLQGVCPVEDAEPLLQMLLSNPAAPLDWTQADQLHASVLQVILAAGAAPVGRCGDAWLDRLTASDLSWFRGAKD